MFGRICLATTLMAVGLALATHAGHATSPADGAQDGSRVSAKARSSHIQVAQRCGLYVIGTCSRSSREANREADEIGLGYVINTSSSNYPNFRSGFYCVVEGPLDDRYEAEAIRRRWLRRGAPSSTYIKDAC